jgi:thiol-disulfide isomerase/thioredoxin
MGSLLPPIDIQDESQLGELDSRISIGPVSIFLVYADWCGHCQKFKPMMEELEKDPNRTVQIGRIRDDVFPKSSLSDTKIEGYPTLMLIKKDGSAVSFKNTQDQVTNAIPDYTNMNQMKTLIRTAGTPQAQTLLQNKKPNNAILTMKPLSPESSMANRALSAEQESLTTTQQSSMPPDILADRLSEPTVNRLNTALATSTKVLRQSGNNPMQLGGGSSGQHGGSLWSQLVMASNEIAPAAALFLGASLLNSSKRSSTRKTKKSKKTKQTRRRYP